MPSFGNGYVGLWNGATGHWNGVGGLWSGVSGFALSALGAGIIVYPTNMGVSTDQTNGLITFSFNSSPNRLIFVNNSATNPGNDANNGLSPSQAVATLATAYSIFQNGSFTQGDKIMVAEGSNLIDPCNALMNPQIQTAGGSPTNISGLFSYDPADALNTAKYGRAMNGKRPVLNLDDTVVAASSIFGCSSNGGNANRGYFAIQGIYFKSGATLGGAQLRWIGRYDYLCFQNNIFDAVQINWDGSADATGTVGYSTNNIISGNAFYNTWANNGNAQAAYIEGRTGLNVFRNVVMHTGWKFGVSRDYPISKGGPHILGHGFYYSAINLGANFFENVFVDVAADGPNFRGNANHYNNVVINTPIALVEGGVSANYTEAPNGVTFTGNDFLAMGSANISQLVGSNRTYGIAVANSIPGSYLRNALFIDNEYYGLQFNNYLMNTQFTPGGLPNGQGVNTTFLYDKIFTKGWAPVGEGGQSVINYPANTLPTYTNSIGDVALPGGTNITNAGKFPGAINKMGVLSAIGFSTKASAVNAMVYTPQFPWATALITAAFNAYGLTTTYAQKAPPSLTGITPTTIWGAPPVNSVAPTLSAPNLVAGSLLTFSSNGTWSNIGTGSYYDYRILRDGTPVHTTYVKPDGNSYELYPVSGTTIDYTITAADVGHTLTGQVLAKNIEGEGNTLNWITTSNSAIPTAATYPFTTAGAGTAGTFLINMPGWSYVGDRTEAQNTAKRDGAGHWVSGGSTTNTPKGVPVAETNSLNHSLSVVYQNTTTSGVVACSDEGNYLIFNCYATGVDIYRQVGGTGNAAVYTATIATTLVAGDVVKATVNNNGQNYQLYKNGVAFGANNAMPAALLNAQIPTQGVGTKVGVVDIFNGGFSSGDIVVNNV